MVHGHAKALCEAAGEREREAEACEREAEACKRERGRGLRERERGKGLRCSPLGGSERSGDTRCKGGNRQERSRARGACVAAREARGECEGFSGPGGCHTPSSDMIRRGVLADALAPAAENKLGRCLSRGVRRRARWEEAGGSCQGMETLCSRQPHAAPTCAPPPAAQRGPQGTKADFCSDLEC